MWLCYAIAAIPLVLGGVLWLWTRRVTFGEWMLGSVIGLVVAVGFHVYAIVTLAMDAQIASGQVAYLTHYPEYPDTEAETGWYDHWAVTLKLPDGRADFEIPDEEAETIRKAFGATEMETARPETYDPSDKEYRVQIARNRTGAPVAGWAIVSARRRSSGPDVFSFSEPPEGLPLHDYPYMTQKGFALSEGFIQDLGSRPHVTVLKYQGYDWRKSGRLLGRAAEDMSIAKWDLLNAELSPKSGVNLIAIGFDGEASIARWQESKWTGGKKNDLVICYGPADEGGKPAWTYCFGWTADETIKRSLESLFLTEGVSDAILPEVMDEVATNYRPREWPEFSYFSLQPPRHAVGILILLTLLLQGRYWVRALLNPNRREASGAAEIAEEAEQERRQTEKSALKALRKELPSVGLETDVELTAAVMVRALFVPYFGARVTALDWLNKRAGRPAVCEEARTAIPWLIDKLAAEDVEMRGEALRLLDLIDADWRNLPEAKSDVPHLLGKLRTKYPKQWHFDALGARGPLVYDDLVEMAEQKGKVTEAHGLRALGHTGDPRAVPRLLEALDAEKKVIRRYALSGLGSFGPGLRDAPEADRFYEKILPLLAGRDHGIRANAVRTLGWLGRDEAVPEISPYLSDSVDSMRYWTADALGWIGTRGAIDALIESLEEAPRNDLPVRIKALGRTRSELIIRPLLDLQRTDIGQAFPATEAIINAVYRLEGDEIDRFLERQANSMESSAPYLADRRLHQRKRNNHAWS